ncbi:MAG: hypothetical protein JRI23_19855 [Deltaproteobacteria bacterium]|jgi:hypothetical protein|nr:hypothetical protein [Deltaproteobacteria bacterium]MBW2534126.1 hypothetical protein [Deltaproteobacteria bacterium]
MAAESGSGAESVARIERNPWVMALAATPFLLCLLAIVGALVLHPSVLVGVLHGLGLGIATSWSAWARNPWPRFRVQELRVREGWLQLGDERIERAHIESGIIIPGTGYHTVQLRRRGLRPPVELRVADEDEGRAILEKLGLAATQTVASFRGMSRVHQSVWLTLATVMGTMVLASAATAGLAALLGPGAATPSMLLWLLVLITLVVAPSRIEVGADGVLVRWLGRTRFIGHADIEEVQMKVIGLGKNRRATVEIALASGEKVVLPTGSAHFDQGRCRGIVRRIRAAHDSFQRGESVHAEALLRRGERTHVDWVKALRSADAHASLRSAPVPRDRLWRIVEDVAVAPLDRAVAAVSLGRRLEADERARLEQTAVATAAPRLRIALDAVARGSDDEALGEVLEEIEAEAAATAPSRARA